MKEDKMIKKFFEDEVNMKKTPPMPQTLKNREKLFQWDNVFMAACIFTCLIVVMLPSAYDNTIRNSYIPISKYEAFKDEFPRVIFDASLYFRAKKGVNND